METNEDFVVHAASDAAKAGEVENHSGHSCGGACGHDHAAPAETSEVAGAAEAAETEDHSGHSCGCDGCGHEHDDPAVAARNLMIGRVNALSQWAFELLQNKQIAAARRFISAASALYDIAGGGECEQAVWLYSIKAFICSDQGKHAAAWRHGRVAIKISRIVSGPESAQHGLVINNIGELLVNAGRMPEAEKLLTQGIGLLNKGLADGNVDKVWAVAARSDALGNYRRLLSATGRQDEADSLVE